MSSSLSLSLQFQMLIGADKQTNKANTNQQQLNKQQLNKQQFRIAAMSKGLSTMIYMMNYDYTSGLLKDCSRVQGSVQVVNGGTFPENASFLTLSIVPLCRIKLIAVADGGENDVVNDHKQRQDGKTDDDLDPGPRLALSDMAGSNCVPTLHPTRLHHIINTHSTSPFPPPPFILLLHLHLLLKPVTVSSLT